MFSAAHRWRMAQRSRESGLTGRRRRFRVGDERRAAGRSPPFTGDLNARPRRQPQISAARSVSRRQGNARPETAGASKSFPGAAAGDLLVCELKLNRNAELQRSGMVGESQPANKKDA